MTVVAAPERTTTVADTLNRAADYLEMYGWLQGEFGEDGGPRCVAGAVRSVTGFTGPAFSNPAIPTLRHYIGGAIAVWNDVPGRTKDEVVAALRAAALTVDDG